MSPAQFPLYLSISPFRTPWVPNPFPLHSMTDGESAIHSQLLKGGWDPKVSPLTFRWDQLSDASCAPAFPMGSGWSESPAETASSLSLSLFLHFCFPLIPSPENAAPAAKSLQSCPTLCNPIDGSPLGSAVPGILQARTLERVAISFSSAGKWKVKVKSLSRVRLLVTSWTAAYRAPPSMGFSRQEYWSGVPLPSPLQYKVKYFLKNRKKKKS